jgi:hypothetical protein
MVSNYLSQHLPNGRLLVVLDGLDEATDWQAGPDLFPFQPPPGLRIVVSARYLAGESGPEGWLRRLEWDRHRLARPLDLDPLTREGVAEVLQNMGFPLDELGRRVDIVAELHRLSEGDPLLVRLYVDDLWAKGEEPPPACGRRTCAACGPAWRATLTAGGRTSANSGERRPPSRSRPCGRCSTCWRPPWPPWGRRTCWP